MVENLNAYQMTFWFCALCGTGFFLINTVMSMISGVDTDLDIVSHHTTHEGIDSPDAAFQLISLTSLTGFVMMFGWIGLTCYEQFHLDPLMTFLCALSAGFITMYLTAKIFQSAKRLASNGSVFDISQALGKVAVVYARIPVDGKGQIQIAISSLTHELDAISSDNVVIESNTHVEVIRILDNATVIVKPINKN
jgi:hypothetical protein